MSFAEAREEGGSDLSSKLVLRLSHVPLAEIQYSFNIPLKVLLKESSWWWTGGRGFKG